MTMQSQIERAYLAGKAAGLGPTRQPATRAYPLPQASAPRRTVAVVRSFGPWQLTRLVELPPRQAIAIRADSDAAR